jgi:SAM-dependent methyltransferase
MKPPKLVNAVDAYSGIASGYGRISEARRLYLEKVEDCIIRQVPKGAFAMLDVGSGDGRRAERIAKSCGVGRLVLLEPSAAMRGIAPEGAETWEMRAEELGRVEDQFDVITCLWNVPGHIDSRACRAQVMKHFARLLGAGGMLFIDFNHRYNAAEYGTARTLLRFLRDTFMPGERNGDVIARWYVDGSIWATKGHVFTDGEVRSLMQEAGLKICRRDIINYASGEIRRWPVTGNLLYAAVNEDRTSPSLQQTSRIWPEVS